MWLYILFNYTWLFALSLVEFWSSTCLFSCWLWFMGLLRTLVKFWLLLWTTPLLYGEIALALFETIEVCFITRRPLLMVSFSSLLSTLLFTCCLVGSADLLVCLFRFLMFLGFFTLETYFFSSFFLNSFYFFSSSAYSNNSYCLYYSANCRMNAAPGLKLCSSYSTLIGFFSTWGGALLWDKGLFRWFVDLISSDDFILNSLL